MYVFVQRFSKNIKIMHTIGIHGIINNIRYMYVDGPVRFQVVLEIEKKITHLCCVTIL